MRTADGYPICPQCGQERTFSDEDHGQVCGLCKEEAFATRTVLRAAKVVIRKDWTLKDFRRDDDGNRNGDEFMLDPCDTRDGQLVLWTPYGLMVPGTTSGESYSAGNRE